MGCSKSPFEEASIGCDHSSLKCCLPGHDKNGVKHSRIPRSLEEHTSSIGLGAAAQSVSTRIAPPSHPGGGNLGHNLVALERQVGFIPFSTPIRERSCLISPV